MAKGVQRGRDVGVSEHLLHELGMLACHVEYCSARVPEILQYYIWGSRAPQEGLEAPVRKGSSIGRSALDGRKDESMILVPSRGLRLVALALVMSLERFHVLCREVHTPTLAAFGLLFHASRAGLGHDAPDL